MPAFRDRHARATPPHTMRPWPLPTVRSELIEELRATLEQADEATRRAAIDDFRARLQTLGTPLIEDDADPAWTRVTFVWIGAAPHGVVLQLNRFTDPLDIEDALLERIAESEVHALTLRVPAAWQAGYLFGALPGRVRPTLHGHPDRELLGALAQRATTDPYARERIPSKAIAATGGRPLPEYAVARGPAAPAVALWQGTPPATTRLGSVVSPVSGAELALHHWASAGACTRSPVVLLGDGEVWREQFPIAAELAERVARGRFPECHLLFLDSGGPRQRELDYTGDARETGALLAAVRSVVRASASRIRSGSGGAADPRTEDAGNPDPEAPWIVAGQSLGGLFAALCATRHPDLVRAAVAQSPSLWWPTAPAPWGHADGWFEEQAGRALPGAPVLLESGAIDAEVSVRCRAAAAVLAARGALIDHREHPGGHDVLQWQATLADELAAAIRATGTA